MSYVCFIVVYFLESGTLFSAAMLKLNYYMYYIYFAEFEVISDVKDFWTRLFSKYFLEGALTSDEIRDDMLFYVRKSPDTKKKSYLKVVCSFIY